MIFRKSTAFQKFQSNYSRRRKHYLGIFLIFFASIFIACNKHQSDEKPNILIINVDDLGWRDVGFMGSEFYHTPNIDQLARSGMVFTNAYSSASNCAPSRASMLTGLWTARHGIYTVGSSERGKAKDRKIIPTTNTTSLDSSFLIFPQILKNHGYTTCAAGKWHVSDDPLKFGFDQNIGGGPNGHPRSYYPPYKNVKLEAINGEYLTDLIASKSIEFIQNAQEPFLLYYTPYAVHTPIQGVDSLKYKYEGKPVWNQQDNISYATMIENLDRNIGEIIKALEKKECLENTIIVFTSDNGGLYGITYQAPLRDGKGSYYEGGIRVPFIISWEGKIAENSKSDALISNLDLFPSLIELAGLENYGGQLDGKSIVPLLNGNHAEFEDRPLFWHFPVYLQAYKKNNNQSRDSLFRTRPGSVIRLGDWKLHHYFEDGGLELYNLETDVSEQHNLLEQFPEKAKELYNLLDKWRKELAAPVPNQLNPEYDP